jgi:hypothetical protein
VTGVPSQGGLLALRARAGAPAEQQADRHELDSASVNRRQSSRWGRSCSYQAAFGVTSPLSFAKHALRKSQIVPLLGGY